MNYTILTGDNRQTLKTLPDNSIDAIITDPPYGIDFLGKAWDANTGALETYQECLRVLKPGGHILAFSAARTYHHLAVTLEAAGFEIRDQIMWIYSSGFPKSQDIGKSIQRSLGVKETKPYKWNAPVKGGRASTDDLGKGNFATGKEEICVTDSEAQAWAGWGTQLKPAHEPIALARKPLGKGLSIAKNCQTWGVGALNIDAARVSYANDKDKMSIDHKVPTAAWSGHTIQVDSYEKGEFVKVETNDLGRFPSNVLGEIPDYQKYFYCPKVSRRERHIGFDAQYSTGDAMRELDGNWTPMKTASGIKSVMTRADGSIMPLNEVQVLVEQKNTGNNHPTVKPIALMRYLIKLITPEGGTVLDPFNGSGSTGCAAVELGHPYIGCELDPAYVEIAEKRIEAWYSATRDSAAEIFE